MPYTPHAPPLSRKKGSGSDLMAGSHVLEKPVTSVTAVAEIQRMSLSQFAREGRAIEVRVPWLDVTLWWVPTADHIDPLLRRGVHRGRIWTARELSDLMKIRQGCGEVARTLARIKLTFGAELVSVDVSTKADGSSETEVRGSV